jgi:iron complex transport system substrate-binding protein
MTRRTRRFPGVVLAALVLALSACGGTSAPDAASTPESSPSTAAAPVTITHKFGTTTVPANPTRVLTVGFNEQDFAIALGAEPVGVREFLGYDAPQRPWLPEALRGKAIPTVGSQEIAFEQVAALQPDLILGINSYMDQATYDKLSALAPTVAQSADFADGGTPWDQQTLQTGVALGKQAEAQQLVDDVTARFDQVRTANPAFAGKSASLLLGGEAASVYALSRSDYRTGWLTELGFTVPEEDATVSLERLEDVDTDVVMAEGLPTSVTGSPLWRALDAVQEKRYVDFGAFDQDFAAALGFNSPLSLPFVLTEAEPRLAAATDGDALTAPQPFPAP